MDEKEFLFEIATKCGLGYYEFEDLVSDVANLRGDEWIEVFENCKNVDEETLNKYKELINYNKEDEDEWDEVDENDQK